MTSVICEVFSDGTGMSDAFALTEKVGAESGLDNKSLLHIRLLAEELFGMLRSIAGDVEANYWISIEDKKLEMHLKSEIELTDEMRKQLYSVSSSGKNDAAKGVMGKIKVMIANFLLSTKEVLPYATMNTVASYNMGIAGAANVAVWSMVSYKDEIEKYISENKEASEAWDELEKSIIASIADDISVKIIGESVEIVISKLFK